MIDSIGKKRGYLFYSLATHDRTYSDCSRGQTQILMGPFRVPRWQSS